jgi:hypothetical protein
MSDKFNPEDMPVLSLNTTGTTRYEASRFLDSPEAIAAYLAESMKANDTERPPFPSPPNRPLIPPLNPRQLPRTPQLLQRSSPRRHHFILTVGTESDVQR